MPTAINDKSAHDVDGATSGPDARAPVVQNPIVDAMPPGSLPQIDLAAAEAQAQAFQREAEAFLAPAPARGGMIRGYGHARTGRMLPHGGSPSSGPLTGAPLTRRGAPTPPVFRRQILEPGHQVPDPLLGLAAAIEVPTRPADELDRSLDRIERASAAVRASAPRRDPAGAPRRVAATAGPAGTGGAQLAASMGMPVAESVRASDRGTYVAGRVGERRGADLPAGGASGAPGEDPCAGAAARPRPLTPLQSMKRYAIQQAAARDKGHDVSGGSDAQSSVRPPGPSPVASSKGMSGAFKGFTKSRASPGPISPDTVKGAHEKSGEERLDLDEERQLLALRAQVSGLAGRFGARRPCRMDQIEALRPPETELLGDPAPAGPAGRGAKQPDAAAGARGTALRGPGEERRSRLRSPGPRAGGGERRGAGAPGLMDGCALPQKYPARAGVMMITTPPVEEVAPPGAPGSASAAEGIAGVRQAPLGQKAYPPQDGDEARARDEAAPGAGGAGGPAGSGAAQRAPAEGMGGSAAPTLLDLDRKFRQEANARIDAQQAASALAELAADTVDAVRKANEQGYLFVKNAKTLDDFQRKSRAITEQLGQAERGMSGPEYGTFSGDLHGAVRSAISLLAEVALQGEGAKGEILAASFHLTATDDVARRAVATLNELWRQKRRIRELGRTLGSMDGSSLRRLALAAEHRAERDAYRAERRALRRERGGAFKARQFADVTAATERAFGFETKAARYQAEADRARKGSAARARAQRNADYYGSLAEAERHHASVARSHIVGAEIGRTKAAREFLKQERANADAHYRNEQKIAKLERLRAQEAQRLERVTAQLDALVAKDEQGNAKKEDGKYVPKHPRDRLKVEQLAKEQEREQQRRGQRTAEIVKLQGENRGLAPSGPFAGTPAGTRLALLRYARVNAYPPKLVRQIAASVNSMMSQVIADASARSSAALDAGFAAARAMYDPFLSPDQRADAAASYVAALAAAEQAVRDISDAIVIKSRNELQGLADYDDEELAQDMAALAAARARLKQLQDPCNACSQKCESNASWICWWERPDPPPFGDPNAPTRGDGSSISSADSSAPGGVEAVAPQGSSESDGSDEPEAETDGTTEARKEEEKAVEPTEAEDDRPRSVAPEKKEEEKKKVTVPDVEVPDVFRQAVGGVTTFAMNVRAGIEDAVGSARAAFREVGRFLDEAAKEAERDTAALDEIKKQEIKRLQDLLTATVQNLMRRIEIAASRGESEAAIEKTIAILRLAKSQLLAQLASMGDGRDPELYRQLKQQYMQVEPTIMGLEEQRRRLESDDSFESTEARQVIVKVLRAELAVVTNLSIRALWAAKDRESVEDAATRLELRMQWARSVADHAYFASLGVQSEEEQVGERSSVADRYAGSVGSIAPPDFARDSIERIKQQIGAYDRKIADFGRQVAKAADERTDRKRVATVALAAAAVAASVLTVGAVAPLALPVGLKAAIIGAAVAGGGDIIRQGAQIIDDPTREFKWGQVGWAYVGGAVAAPVLVVAPELAAALSIYGGATAVKEIREGHYATGFLDAAMSAAPFLSGAGRAQMFGKGTIFDEGGTAGIAERLGRLKLPGQPPVRPPAINLAGEGEIPGVVNQNIKIIMDPAWRTSRGGLTLSEVRALSYNPKFVVSANERLPFRSDYFQTVYTNSAPIDKTTIFGPGVVPSEVIRVLRPGGQWIVDGQVYFTK